MTSKLTTDIKFISTINGLIDEILADKTIDATDIPNFVLIAVQVYNNYNTICVDKSVREKVIIDILINIITKHPKFVNLPKEEQEKNIKLLEAIMKIAVPLLSSVKPFFNKLCCCCKSR